MIHRVREPTNKIIYLSVDEYKPYDKDNDYLDYE
jgi:hypothetical protein